MRVTVLRLWITNLNLPGRRFERRRSLFLHRLAPADESPQFSLGHVHDLASQDGSAPH